VTETDSFTDCLQKLIGVEDRNATLLAYLLVPPGQCLSSVLPHLDEIIPQLIAYNM